MRSKCETLLVRHLPSALSEAEKVDLLKYFGADTVRCMRTCGKLRNSAFASFPTADCAEYALGRLHQAELLGSRLIAEYALEKQLDRHFPSKADQFPRASADDACEQPAAAPKDEYKSKMESFAIKLHALSSDMGLDYVLNPTLTYAYPPPSPSVVANIATLLLSVPKFYNQVLHLMNKMNLPAPSGPLLPQPPMMQHAVALLSGGSEALLGTAAAAANHESSLEESEMESDEEERMTRRLPTVVPQKRKSKTPTIRRPKLQKLLPPHPAQEHAPKVSDVFEPVAEEKPAPKPIAINIRHETGNAPEAGPTAGVQEGGFGVLPAQPRPSEPTEAEEEPSDAYDWSGTQFLPREELRAGRISSEEMGRASVFKNYQAGELASRLYIKNVAKAATVDDLFQIYGGYIDAQSEQQRNAFDIRLMKEGRMKGQAFLTLATESQADRARRDTNGYLLKGKPLVVQFARSAKAKKAAS